MNKQFVRSLVSNLTEVTRAHMTPEIGLHLITPSCHLWKSPIETCPFDDPFWAFYWPGGQVLTRYILDNPDIVKNKYVLDIGSGCGAASIAAKMSGAHTVIANDIDPVSLVAIDINMEENKVKLDVSNENLISKKIPGFVDVVLIGDMFYDPDFAKLITNWIHLFSLETSVLVGDPNRLPFLNHPLKKSMKILAKYELPEICRLENNGLTTGNVWLYKKS